jgi:molecular chaperone DnaJ
MKNKKKNLYRMLNLDRDAGPSEIKRAYRRAAKRYHPDISSRNDEKFKEIQEAYETLSNPEKKLIYDQELLSMRKGRSPIKETASRQGSSFGLFDWMDPFRSFNEAWSDFVSDFFWEEGRPQTPSVEVLLTPAEASEGTEVVLDVPYQIPCSRCLGTGRIGRLICGNCRGQGKERLEKKVTLTLPAGIRDGAVASIPIEIPSLEEDLHLLVTVHVSRY